MLKKLIAIVALCLSIPASAALTDAQQQTLAAAIRASSNVTVVAALAQRNDTALTEYYNAASSAIVWKTRVSNDDIGDAMNGSEVAGLSSLNMQRAQMLANYSSGYQNPSRADRRAAFDQIFSGAGGATTRTALAALWRRPASNAEILFAICPCTTQTPGTLVWEGPVSLNDISDALNKY